MSAAAEDPGPLEGAMKVDLCGLKNLKEVAVKYYIWLKKICFIHNQELIRLYSDTELSPGKPPVHLNGSAAS